MAELYGLKRLVFEKLCREVKGYKDKGSVNGLHKALLGMIMLENDLL